MLDPQTALTTSSTPVVSTAASTSPANWPYPGARWWRFDFHTHTPASTDTYWSSRVGTSEDLSPESWLGRYMAAQIDCVAITDHNTGEWIDRLKSAYQQMEGAAIPGFRPMTLFPGVELSVQGGFHLLAVFDPDCTSRDVTRLLGAVRYSGTYGDSDGVTGTGLIDTIDAIHNAGAIAIPAHADRPGASGKALFAVEENSLACRHDANTLKDLLVNGKLLAVEWENLDRPFPTAILAEAAGLTKILGSDCHSFQGAAIPGSRFTWVKMERPTLEGLRLALLDGNDTSVVRSGGLETQAIVHNVPPAAPPGLMLTRLSISQARCMGQGMPAKLEFNPWFNAIIGGRGSGKSTWIHALRLVLNQSNSLESLGPSAEAYRQFDSFRQVVNGRGQLVGGLRDTTEIELELQRDGIPHRLRWQPSLITSHIDEQSHNGGWQPSASQAITAERFPILLFSQGQISALADQGRSTLLNMIDQAAGLAPQMRRIEDFRSTYLSQRARLRELESRLAQRPERERELNDLRRRLKELAELDPSTVLADQQRVARQQRELDRAHQQLEQLPTAFQELAAKIPLDDWPDSLFEAERDEDVMSWRREIDADLIAAQAQLRELAARVSSLGQSQSEHPGILAWRARGQEIQQAAQRLESELAARGLADPGLMQRWIQEKHRLEILLQELDGLEIEMTQLQQANHRQWQRILESIQQRTRARQDFLDSVLRTNSYVRIGIHPFGHDPELLRAELRQLLDLDGNGFESDISTMVDGITNAPDRLEAVATLKQAILDEQVTSSIGVRLRKNLDQKLDKPGFGDAIRCWLPSDDLDISYSRRGNGRDWKPIQQGSQGQKASALLAFLLSFGDEPLVLDQPEDDLDNKLISELVVAQIRANKMRRQLLIVTHNPNVVVNGDAELVTVMDFGRGQCYVKGSGPLQDSVIQADVCAVMEGGRDALARRWARIGREV